jgi:hypothetical protein
VNSDFLDMLSALSAAGADFLVVGAFAMSAHGYARSTGDIDIWVRPTPENAKRVWKALSLFQAPIGDLTLDDLSSADLVFQLGLPPRRIDLLTSIAGVEFEEAWATRLRRPMGAIEVSFLSREWLIVNKQATGRPRDAADAAWLAGDP